MHRITKFIAAEQCQGNLVSIDTLRNKFHITVRVARLELQEAVIESGMHLFCDDWSKSYAHIFIIPKRITLDWFALLPNNKSLLDLLLPQYPFEGYKYKVAKLHEENLELPTLREYLQERLSLWLQSTPTDARLREVVFLTGDEQDILERTMRVPPRQLELFTKQFSEPAPSTEVVSPTAVFLASYEEFKQNFGEGIKIAEVVRILKERGITTGAVVTMTGGDRCLNPPVTPEWKIYYVKHSRYLVGKYFKGEQIEKRIKDIQAWKTQRRKSWKNKSQPTE